MGIRAPRGSGKLATHMEGMASGQAQSGYSGFGRHMCGAAARTQLIFGEKTWLEAAAQGAELANAQGTAVDLSQSDSEQGKIKFRY